MSKANPKARGTSRATKPRKVTTKGKGPPKAIAKAKLVRHLVGGNPQIAKADGDAPVQTAPRPRSRAAVPTRARTRPPSSER